MKGFKITFDVKRKQPWKVEYIGNRQQVSYFNFGTGDEPILKCVKCGAILWKDLEVDIQKILKSPKMMKDNLEMLTRGLSRQRKKKE